MVSLSPASRRRYGGYIVHFGIVLMFFGFTGKSWTVDRETSLQPQQSLEVGKYTLTYEGSRMEVDNTKRMVFADIRVSEGGKARGKMSPAKFIYKKMPESPTTEVAMMHSVSDDLYIVVGTINPQTKVASLQVHVNPLVGWIWLGCLILIGGSILCLWPELVPGESRLWNFARGSAAVTASIMIGIFIAVLPAKARADGTSSLHAGTVRIENDRERDIFAALRCMCGTCARDILSTCACGWAEDAREELRDKIAKGMSKEEILAEFARLHGTESLSVPPNEGALKAIYLLPLTLIGVGGAGLAVAVARWRKNEEHAAKERGSVAQGSTLTKDEYDARLDEELRDLDG
jgi:cytochrome c-type biogenesis protein CcmF